jgi:hypothetical protein
VIAERADFDERYFPLSKRPSFHSITPPSPAVENTPAVTTALPPSAAVETTPAATATPHTRLLPAAPKPASMSYYLHDSDSDDESSSDESLDHGGEIGPPALPAVVPVVPAPAPASASPPPHSPSPVPPPRPPSPVGIGARLPRRTRTKPREWWKLSNAQLDDEVDDDIEDAEMGYEIALSTVSNAEPLSYAEALRRPDAEQWKHAALEELNAHSTNGTWKLVPRSAGKKVIGSKWVFKVKCNADGSIECYKGRVVAKGYNQRPGFDYIETLPKATTSVLALTTSKSSPLLSGYPRFVLSLPFQHSMTTTCARLIYPMPTSMGRWTVTSTWSSLKDSLRATLDKLYACCRRASMAPSKVAIAGTRRCVLYSSPWASPSPIQMPLSKCMSRETFESSCLCLWMT